MFSGASFLFLASVSLSSEPYSAITDRKIWTDDSHTVYQQKSDKLSAVNAWVNSVPYSYEKEDNWLDPDTFFTQGGDCEDYALAKMKILRSQGVPATQLRLVLVRNHLGLPHAVLLHSSGKMFDNSTLVLDSETDKIVPLYRRKDLTPFVSFSQSNIHVHKNGDWNAEVVFDGLPQHGNKWAAVQGAYNPTRPAEKL
ncbi:transglutaminase-like cysteine peptidase [Pseudoteredinibacter isoporae]|uniref:Putative transglutaminase-like cysteine proteinase n=1 Tax=Pseudoteredinibacter isoporae TaxID=570281 RepID=A0A7X0MWS7_9GAMM|nr:transglutaminase-like cysteine peptidase [Pseudoteredinibacter isoporae]MBB6523036.1 putative transglutaminase-like cysteine proteinase [Pseudoteredinibacter isoporae]NHO88558.1 transglutaminase-like cysteine peptidase [Pseudoteredinibacter isoporae]NIB22751.1 transglutaminase-like cysteine peptidase [Pseudoteredinibacter isoporae]